NALEQQFRQEGYRVFKSLDRPGDIADNQLPDSSRAVIAIGGDGTLRGVAERLYQANKLAPLLPVPLGTANLMGRHLGISWEGRDVAGQIGRAVSRHQVRMLDAGRVNERMFLLMAGIGFDAKVIYHLDRMRNGPIRIWDYLIPTGLSLTAEPGSPMRVLLDDIEIFQGPRALAFVGNLSEYGTGFPVLPYARGDDGLLDVCVLPCESRADLVHLFLLAAAGEHVQAEGVVYRRGKHVRIESPEKIPVQADGDPAGFTPVEIDLLPVQVPFIVP
ncbi:MAG TPA: diacylglycerol kinase family protein, partial [Tepidisphaeraceae bacterium]|nr:diacylglycerol kinase family protein [Tepidisphaeraceae bacterium]